MNARINDTAQRADRRREGGDGRRRRHVAQRRGRAARHPGAEGDRRPDRCARRTLDRRPVGRVPVRHRARRHVGPRARRGGRSPHRQRGAPQACHVLLAPTVNIHRHPLAGRNFECYSEDPYLTARIAVAYITGVQSQGVGSCVKHFVANDSEFERMTISSEVDERTLREIYLPPFEAAVREAGVWSVMSAYNRLNGTYCSEHPWLLDTLLKQEWGFDGLVMSDWFGTHSTADAANAGLDLEMPGPPQWFGPKLAASGARRRRRREAPRRDGAAGARDPRAHGRARRPRSRAAEESDRRSRRP